MSINPAGYPLDLSGENPRNLVINDERRFATAEESIFVPDGGPFYTRSLVVKSGSRILKPNVDYKCLHLLKEASIESGYDVSAVVSITDESISSVTMTYQVIGGQYAETTPVIRQLLENANNLDRSINWNTNVFAKPKLFTPAPHYMSGEDFSDWAGVLNGLQAIERAIMLKDVAAWESAYLYVDNIITNRLAAINLSDFYTKSEINIETAKLALANNVYTKVESNDRHYSKSQVDALIGDIDGNESYYTEREVDAKFIETNVADAKYGTKAEVNRLDSIKADRTSVYTRAQCDDKFPLKIDVYDKDYIDVTYSVKGTSFTKSESDSRYAFKLDAYTKVDSDKRYALKSQIAAAPDLSNFITRNDADSVYLKINTADVVYLRKTTADSLYAKHTDLAIIQVLSDKFKNYYTRVEVDNKFITTANVNSIFITKVQANGLYYSKSYVASTFATKTELASNVASLVKDISKKVDNDFLETQYRNKADSDKRYYTKSISNERFHTKQHVDLYFVNKTTLKDKLSLYVTRSVHDSAVDDINESLANRYTRAQSDNLYYTKTYSDKVFTPVSSFNSEVSEIKESLATKVTSTWVNKYFYSTSQANARYYTKSAVDNAFYNKTESNNRFVNKTSYDAQIKKLVTTDKYTAGIAALNSALNDRYKKSETYSKSESDNRYYNASANLLEIKDNSSSIEGSGLRLSRFSSGADTSPLVDFRLNNSRVGALFFENKKSGSQFLLNTKRTDNGRDIRTLYIDNTRIWHSTYGNLHDYFAKESSVYTKNEVYTKSESVSRFASLQYVRGTFVSNSEHEKSIAKVERLLGGKADITWVNGNFYTKTDITKNYSTTSAIRTAHYLKSDADARFATKTNLSSEVSKLATKSSLTSSIANVTSKFNGYYTKRESDILYSTKTETNKKADASWVGTNYYSKSEINSRNYTKPQVDAKFSNKESTNSEISELKRQLEELRRLTETYKVNDIYVTFNNFTSGSAVTNHHGYGTWVRCAQGRTLVGRSSNGYVDGNVRSDPSGYYYLNATRAIGKTFGSFKHLMDIDEVPSHVHSQFPFNKFVGLGRDVLDRYKGQLYKGNDVTSEDNDTGSAHDELAIADLTSAMLKDAVERPMGGSKSHNNTQPSVVVGMWVRIS